MKIFFARFFFKNFFRIFFREIFANFFSAKFLKNKFFIFSNFFFKFFNFIFFNFKIFFARFFKNKFSAKFFSRNFLKIIFFRQIFWLLIFWPAICSASMDNEVVEAFGRIGSIIVNVLVLFSILILNIIGDLIGGEILLGDEIMSVIRPMWIFVRNITNICFVVILLFLAFSNLFASFGGESKMWTIKDKLPKVIFSLVAINFSLLGCRVLIDIVNVGTIALFSISDSILESKEAGDLQKIMTKKFHKEKYFQCCDNGCKYLENDPNCISVVENLNYAFCKPSETKKYEDFTEEEKAKCTMFIKDPATWSGTSKDKQTEAARNLFMSFSIFFQHLEKMPLLSAKLRSWTDVIDSTIFAGILSLAFIVTLVSLFFVLIARVIVLWMVMIFSPLIVAASIMGFGGEAGKGAEMFFTHLIAPLKVAAIFSVTFVMISGMTGFQTSQSIFNNGGMEIEFGPSLSVLGHSGAYGLLWQIFTIIIFWKGSTWALDGTVAKSIVDPVRKFAGDIGSYVAKAATVENQFLPAIGGEKMSIAGLGTFSNVLQTKKSTALTKQRTAIEKKLAGGGSKEEIEARGETDIKLNKLEKEVNPTIKLKRGKILETTNELGSAGFKNNLDAAKKYAALLEKAGALEKSKIKQFTDLFIKGYDGQVTALSSLLNASHRFTEDEVKEVFKKNGEKSDKKTGEQIIGEKVSDTEIKIKIKSEDSGEDLIGTIKADSTKKNLQYFITEKGPENGGEEEVRKKLEKLDTNDLRFIYKILGNDTTNLATKTREELLKELKIKEDPPPS